MATGNRKRCKHNRASGPASSTNEVAHAVRSAGPASRAEFVKHGLAGLAEAERKGVFYSAEQVLDELRALTQARRERLSGVRVKPKAES